MQKKFWVNYNYFLIQKGSVLNNIYILIYFKYSNYKYIFLYLN